MDIFLTRFRQGDTSVLADLLVYIESAPLPISSSSNALPAITNKSTNVIKNEYRSHSFQEQLALPHSDRQCRREMYTTIVHFLHKEGRKLHQLSKLTSTPQEVNALASLKVDNKSSGIRELAKSLHLLPSSYMSSDQHHDYNNNRSNNKGDRSKSKEVNLPSATVTYTLPPATAITALRILTVIGMRKYIADSKMVRDAILQLGLQACRELCLDAYCILPRAELYYVVKFTVMLMDIFGCLAADLVRERNSIALVESAAYKCAIHNIENSDTDDDDDDDDEDVNDADDVELQERVRENSEHTAETHQMNRNGRSGQVNNRTPRLISPRPPPSLTSHQHSSLLSSPSNNNNNSITNNNRERALSPTAATTIVPHNTQERMYSNVRARMYSNICTNWYPSHGGHANNRHSTRHTTRYVQNPFINGTTRDAIPTTYPGRRYRPMPDKPSYEPFAQNPLYEAECHAEHTEIKDSDNDIKNRCCSSRISTSSTGSNNKSSIQYIWKQDEYIEAQFPWPILHFARCYGLGCVPQIPIITKLTQCHSMNAEETHENDVERSSTNSSTEKHNLHHKASSTAHSRRSSSTVMYVDSPHALDEMQRLTSSNLHTEHDSENYHINEEIETNMSSKHDNGVANNNNCDSNSEEKIGNGIFTRRPISGSSFRTLYLSSNVSESPSLLERYIHHGQVHYWGSKSEPSLCTSMLDDVIIVVDNNHANNDKSSKEDVDYNKESEEHLMLTPNQDQVEEIELCKFATVPQEMKLTTRAILATCGDYTCYYYFVLIDGRVCCCKDLKTWKNKNKQTYDSDKSNETSSRKEDDDNEKVKLEFIKLFDDTSNNSTSNTTNNSSNKNFDDRVMTLQTSGNSAIAITQNGFVYVWGDNRTGQCLKPAKVNSVSSPFRFRPGQRVPRDAALSLFSGAITFSDGAMATWGESSLLGELVPPNELETSQIGSRIIHCLRGMHLLPLEQYYHFVRVYAGPAHMLAITTVGQVFAWGHNAHGQCGHGVHDSTHQEDSFDSVCLQPTMIDALRTYCVVEASCGDAHSAVLTREGKVFVFGSNAHGQLGLYQPQSRYLPVMLTSLPCVALSIACGSQHTIILLEDGDLMACGSVYTCGSGIGTGTMCMCAIRIHTSHLTLSITSSSSSALSRSVSLGCARDVVYIRFDSTCTNVTTSSSNINEDKSSLSTLPESFTMHDSVRCIVCGSTFMIVLMNNGTAYATGRGEYGQLGIHPAHRANIVTKREEDNNKNDDDNTKTNSVIPKHGEKQLDGHDVERNSNLEKICTIEVKSFVEIATPSQTFFQYLCGNNNFVLALDNHGCVYGWGRNVANVLCCDTEYDNEGNSDFRNDTVYYTPHLLTCYNTVGIASRIVQIVCGDAFVLALTLHGDVWAHGEYKYCGLGQLGSESNKSKGNTSKNYMVNGKCNAEVTNNMFTKTSEQHENGIVIPQKISHLNNIIRIAAGPRHALALDANGILYTWGDSHCYASDLHTVGASEHTHFTKEKLFYDSPVKVRFIQPIRAIGCGVCNSYIITSTDALYVWGDNTHCQCGATQLLEHEKLNTNAQEKESQTHRDAYRNNTISSMHSDRFISSNASATSSTFSNTNTTMNSCVTTHAHDKLHAHLLEKYVRSPTLVARNVRDVALGRYVGVMVDLSGAVRVSGLVRRDNKECYVYGFYDEPFSLIKLPDNNYYRNANTNNMSAPSSISPLAFSLQSPILSSSSSSSSSSCSAANTTAASSTTTRVKVTNTYSSTKITEMKKERRPICDVHESRKWDKTVSSSDIEYLSEYEAPATSSERTSSHEEEWEQEKQQHVQLHQTASRADEQTKTITKTTTPAVKAKTQHLPVHENITSTEQDKPVQALDKRHCTTVTPLHCFCGGEHMYIALEKNRPTPQQVRHAFEGLRVLPCVREE